MTTVGVCSVQLSMIGMMSGKRPFLSQMLLSHVDPAFVQIFVMVIQTMPSLPALGRTSCIQGTKHNLTIWRRVFSKVHFLSRFVSSSVTDSCLMRFAQAYKHIFTSPTSAAIDEENAIPSAGSAKRQKTGTFSKRSPVATIINLGSVSPRSIAYITVQVLMAFSRFLLSADC
jgi:hypothetical protein